MCGMIFRVLSAICLPFLVMPAGAADIKISDHPLYDIILEGTIVPGDYDKLRKLIEANCPSKSWSRTCPSQIYLASAGGSLTEAMKMGRLIRALRLETQVPEDFPDDLRQKTVTSLKLQDPKNYLCASACFFIAIAGIERSYGHKVLLGIHRPYLSDADLKTLSANQAIASVTQVRTIVEAYLKEMSVPSKYLDLMFSIPKDQVRWIDEADYEADFDGLIPELKDWMDARCDKRTDVEKRLDDILEAKRPRFTPEEKSLWLMLNAKRPARVECEGMVKEKLREDAWKTYRGL